MDIFKKNCAITFIVIFTFITLVGCNINIKKIAEGLSEDLNELKNDELAVPYILKYSSYMFTSSKVDVLKNVKTMAQKLQNKISDTFSALENVKSTIDILNKNVTQVVSALYPCIHRYLFENLENNLKLDNLMDHEHVLQQLKGKLGVILNAAKRYYIISDSQLKHLQFSPFSVCKEDETSIWNNYILRNEFKRRNLVLILDTGSSLSANHLYIIKTLAKQMISVLSPYDRVALIIAGKNYTSLDLKNNCQTDGNLPLLISANSTYVQILHNYINSLEATNGPTNHSFAIEKGLKVINKETDFLKNETVMMLYVSRGLLSSFADPEMALRLIGNFTDNYNFSLVINTCAIVDETRTIIYKPQFLSDIAIQNYTQYNISIDPNVPRKKGLMLTVNNTKSIPFIVSRFYDSFRINLKTGDSLSLPSFEHGISVLDMMVSLTKSWANNNNFYIIGTEVHFSNLAEDIIFYTSNQENSYAFLMDLNLKVLVHPSFYKPTNLNSGLKFTDVSNFERIATIDELKQKFLDELEGSHNASKFKLNGEDLVNYTWSRAGKWYIICIVQSLESKTIWRPFKTRFRSADSKFLHHNIQDYKLCRHLNLLATMDVPSLYLSPSCFQSPHGAFKSQIDKSISQGYLAYLKDETRLLANPGLKEEVRDQVLAISHVLEFLRQQHISSHKSKYIVRRYAASYTGVLQMFPGSILKPGLQPTKRPWFVRAFQNKGKVIIIPPYLDKGGAGYIVTIAYATSQLVVAMDLTYGFVLKIILKQMPICLDDKITCFLIDDQGYIVYHPNMMDVNSMRPVVEQQHIVHKESLVSNDILNHKNFIRKLLCNNYADSTIQRFYRLNTSFEEALVNFVPSDHCVTYRIALVPDSNVFIGVVNASCKVVATFCPCSIVDRLCLNCNRMMEQKECECPCECPLDPSQNEVNTCKLNDFTGKNLSDNLPCTEYVEGTTLDTSFTIDTESEIESCFPNNCRSQKTYLDCLGLVGCEWCKFDRDKNYLSTQFCASINTCFNGIFDMATSYSLDIPSESGYTPLGLILGSLLALCVLFVLLFVCYRSYTNPANERLYLSSTQDQLRMSDLNVNDTFHDSGNHRDKLLQEECQNVLSPYSVSNTYRRAALPADSDHGYSTMTPHDESEHLSLAPIEVDSLEDDILSDSTSVQTSVSARDTSQLVSPVFTKFANKNFITVPVTVHRNMEKT